jgi:exosome complex component RRP41
MFKKRSDGRGFDELRKMDAKIGVIKRADGSAMFKIGGTVAIAAVYGPRNLYPKFKQRTDRAVLRCNYNMMAFSGSGERVRPGPSRRSKEISLVTEKALLPVLDLSEHPGAVVDVFVELVQTDSGTRCAGICAAALALADAGFKMKDLISSIAVGRVGDKILVDVNKEEEGYEAGMADMPVAVMPRSGNITLLQMDGFATKEEIKKMIGAAKKACKEVHKVQQKALREKFK